MSKSGRSNPECCKTSRTAGIAMLGSPAVRNSKVPLPRWGHKRRMNLPAQVVVLGVANDADDLPARVLALIGIVILRVVAASKMLADGIDVGKVGAHEGFIHDGGNRRLRNGGVRAVREPRGRPMAIFRRHKVAPHDEGHLHRLKEVRADGHKSASESFSSGLPCRWKPSTSSLRLARANRNS